jgi:hypothetical protein
MWLENTDDFAEIFLPSLPFTEEREVQSVDRVSKYVRDIHAHASPQLYLRKRMAHS